MASAWSFLTLEEDDRQFMGNSGYEDDPARFYSWDETVPNHGRVGKGDLAVLRDADFILGIGWIDNIVEWLGDKERFRCPFCTKTGFKARKKLTPRFKCSACGNVFDSPHTEHLQGIQFYRADYGRTWQTFDKPVPVSAIQNAYLTAATQHAIRALGLSQVRTLIDTQQEFGEPWWMSASPQGIPLPGGHTVVLGRARIGQQRFRLEMLSRFGSRCAICGPLHPAVLEAAHLYRYADLAQHELDGGLLLRRDLHALFDRRLLLIDPDEDWRVKLAPSLQSFEVIWRYDGAKLDVEQELRPNPAYLREHAALSIAGWYGHHGRDSVTGAMRTIRAVEG